MSNKPQATEQPSSFPENWVTKVGDVLIAIDPWAINFTEKDGLIVGKEYPVFWASNDCFSIKSEIAQVHTFGSNEAMGKLFKLKPKTEAEIAHIKRYFIANGFRVNEDGFVGSWEHEIIKEDGIPLSIKYILDEVKKKTDAMDYLTITSISELSETDYKQFYGEE
jgi:hypothetical protein